MCVPFSNDEEGYSTWLSENPEGFVFNHFKGPDLEYNILHRASCNTLHRTDRRQENRTTVEKFVSVNLDALVACADLKRGPDGWHRCKVCTP